MNVGLFAYVGKSPSSNFSGTLPTKLTVNFVSTPAVGMSSFFQVSRLSQRRASPEIPLFNSEISLSVSRVIFIFSSICPKDLLFLLKFPFAKFPFSFERIRSDGFFRNTFAKFQLRFAPRSAFFQARNCRRGRPFLRASSETSHISTEPRR